MSRFVEKLTNRVILKLGVLIHQANRRIAQETLPEFGNQPKNLKIELPRRIVNPNYIFWGDDVWLGPNSLLVAVTSYPGVMTRHPDKPQATQTFTPKISIGHRVSATGGLQIAAHSQITVEDDVIFATNINLTDALHGYDTAHEPYKYQPMNDPAPITIKRGCWIGQNVVILPGVTVGEFSIIGANSVVNKSIPPRCIAVGSPAKVIKCWDETAQDWQTIDADFDEKRLPLVERLPGYAKPKKN